ncbi:hypothetical protein SAMN06297387_103435 [Streptomyces zhaozhouensis]|uniref:Uncharacterized protein n=1 Tax=Streptomyces zhaozhouensis TaxID=1300267 RepID=A0A286DT06_9ACTN|nr:hypothetical protein [Streptomyces zhaozhouensis]SOD61827.1 hypothetical protein SAMN06297387_103435 [Streptomyces zhaozhouensis]
MCSAQSEQIDGPRDSQAAEEPAEEAGGPAPLGVGVSATGHGPVDAVLARLADVDQLGVGGHREVYEDVHDGLRRTLAALDEQPSGPPVPRAPEHPRS